MKENIKTACIKFFFPALTILILYVVFKYAFWIVFPFLFAFLVAFLIRKVVVLLINVTGLRLKEASFVLLLLCYIAFFTLTYFLSVFLIKKGTHFAQSLPQIYQVEIEPFILNLVNNNKTQNSVINLLMSEIKNITSTFVIDISGRITNFALNIPDVLITIAVTIIASFFLCLDYDNIKNNILIFLPEKLKIRIRCFKENVILGLGKMLKCYLIIFAITFIELFLGLTLLRVRFPIYIALLIAFADFLPLIGTGTILIPWAIVSIISGKSAFSVGIIALYLIITIIRNIIEPKILGKNIGIHPLITLAAVYVGLKIGGFLMAFLMPLCLMIYNAAKNNKQI